MCDLPDMQLLAELNATINDLRTPFRCFYPCRKVCVTCAMTLTAISAGTHRCQPHRRLDRAIASASSRLLQSFNVWRVSVLIQTAEIKHVRDAALKSQGHQFRIMGQG
jgi:hypothetical protein